MTNRTRAMAWAAVAAAFVSLLFVAVLDGGGVETDAERIQRLNESFACPECRGESVADSNAAVAANIRQFVAAEVAAGATDLEIRNDLLRAYEAQVLLNPPADGLAALLWILPVAIVVAGATAVTALATRRPPTLELTDADRERVAAARSTSGATVDGDEGRHRGGRA